ncbi:MAG: LysM peptidoglycan-binding domain-containing protein [Anaerolineales bacterium]|nr:LysM peptidoglycan-binding domain-containing protein [Anaerolineales bacterium]
MKRSLLWLLLGLALPALACNVNAGNELAQGLTATAVLAIPTMQPTATRTAVQPSPNAAGTVTDTPPAALTPTATGTPAATPTTCVRRNAWPTLTVQPGDTLFRIAQRVGSSVDELVAANCLPDRNFVSAGQELHVPRLPTPTPSPSPTPQPTVISDWTDPVVVPPESCYTAPFLSDAGVAVGERWRIVEGVGGVTLHGEAVANDPTIVLGGGAPFTIVAGPTCFTARFGGAAAQTLAFRRWQVQPESGGASGWLDEWDPFTDERLLTPDPRVISFTASADTIATGDAVTLSWEVEGADEVYLFTHHNLLRFGSAALNDGDPLPPSGSLTDTPPAPLRRVQYSIGLAPRDAATVTIDVTCADTFFVQTRDTLFACPLGPPAAVQSAYQPFERGFMVWHDGMVWVFAEQTSSGAFVDAWNGEPITYPEAPPAGLWLPERGFGKVWVDNVWVRNALGWALTPEQAYSMTLQQTQTAFSGYAYFFDVPDGRFVEAYLYYGVSLDWNYTTRNP